MRYSPRLLGGTSQDDRTINHEQRPELPSETQPAAAQSAAAANSQVPAAAATAPAEASPPKAAPIKSFDAFMRRLKELEQACPKEAQGLLAVGGSRTFARLFTPTKDNLVRFSGTHIQLARDFSREKSGLDSAKEIIEMGLQTVQKGEQLVFARWQRRCVENHTHYDLRNDKSQATLNNILNIIKTQLMAYQQACDFLDNVLEAVYELATSKTPEICYSDDLRDTVEPYLYPSRAEARRPSGRSSYDNDDSDCDDFYHPHSVM